MFKPGDLVECVSPSTWPDSFGFVGMCYLVLEVDHELHSIKIEALAGPKWASSSRFRLFEEVHGSD